MHAGNCLRLCGKGGVENSRSCHCDCLALIKLLRSKDNGWYIAERRERSTTTEVDLWHRRFTFRLCKWRQFILLGRYFEELLLILVKKG